MACMACMHGRITDLLKARTWRAGRAFLKAVGAYHRRDYRVALAHFDEAMSVDALRTDVHMAFRSVLLALNRGPTGERLDLYKRIISGEFLPSRTGSKYAQAYAN